MKVLIRFLFIAFVLCLSTCIGLVIYFMNYYMGKSLLIQSIYYMLFFISIGLLILILALKIFNVIKNN